MKKIFIVANLIMLLFLLVYGTINYQKVADIKSKQSEMINEQGFTTAVLNFQDPREITVKTFRAVFNCIIINGIILILLSVYDHKNRKIFKVIMYIIFGLILILIPLFLRAIFSPMSYGPNDPL